MASRFRLRCSQHSYPDSSWAFVYLPKENSNRHNIPTWLLDNGTAFLRRHVRQSKYDPLVDEVELIDVTPTYARVKHPSGLERMSCDVTKRLSRKQMNSDVTKRLSRGQMNSQEPPVQPLHMMNLPDM